MSGRMRRWSRCPGGSGWPSRGHCRWDLCARCTPRCSAPTRPRRRPRQQGRRRGKRRPASGGPRTAESARAAHRPHGLARGVGSPARAVRRSLPGRGSARCGGDGRRCPRRSGTGAGDARRPRRRHGRGTARAGAAARAATGARRSAHRSGTPIRGGRAPRRAGRPGRRSDLDRSLEAVADALAHGRVAGLDELTARDWRRPELALCLLVDTSGSMGGERLAVAALAAAAARCGRHGSSRC